MSTHEFTDHLVPDFTTETCTPPRTVMAATPPRSYQPPRIRTFTNQEVEAVIGPAQMCSPNPCGVSP
ncbi:hypothetical protein CCP3SC1_260016 [Gammaproteobacteria bacterium]